MPLFFWHHIFPPSWSVKVKNAYSAPFSTFSNLFQGLSRFFKFFAFCASSNTYSNEIWYRLVLKYLYLQVQNACQSRERFCRQLWKLRDCHCSILKAIPTIGIIFSQKSKLFYRLIRTEPTAAALCIFVDRA